MSVSAVREQAHQHVVGVYDDDHDLVTAITDFLGEALRHGGAAIVVATPQHRAAVDAALTHAGFSPEAVARAGVYLSVDAATTLAAFMIDGRPSPERFASTVGGVVAGAAARGGPVRVFGEMVSLLWDEGNLEGAIELESLWNTLAAQHTFAVLCAYAMSSLETSGDLGAAKRMCDLHERVIPLSEGRLPVAPRVDGNHYDRVFMPFPSALRDVRLFTRHTASTWADVATVEDAELIASELATNAVKHARSAFRVSLSRSDEAITISVRDASFSPPEQLTRAGHFVGGHGMQLVAGLARAWGTRLEPDGKTVWAQLALVPGV